MYPLISFDISYIFWYIFSILYHKNGHKNPRSIHRLLKSSKHQDSRLIEAFNKFRNTESHSYPRFTETRCFSRANFHTLRANAGYPRLYLQLIEIVICCIDRSRTCSAGELPASEPDRFHKAIADSDVPTRVSTARWTGG